MPNRISENDLFLPALYVLFLEKKANTSQIKDALIAAFKPTGEDNEILAGRNDTKFTQIVRNLMGSHYSTNGMSYHTVKDENHYFSLTAAGIKAVEDNQQFLEFLFNNSFQYESTKKLASKIHAAQGKTHKLYIYSENDVILEGKAVIKNDKVKIRSKRLRDAAMQYYTVNGKIKCYVCGFDFEEQYGEHGSGYIQIHHETPIYQYSDEGFRSYIKEAILNMKPVCANCHCMIHRNNAHMLTINELKMLINTTSRF